MRKKIALCFTLMGSILLTGCSFFETVESVANKEEKPTYTCCDDLENNKAYVWHHKDGDIRTDLDEGASEQVFFPLVRNSYNFKGQELDELYEHKHTLWFEDGLDEEIPTVREGDYLLYVSDTKIPEQIVFERYADYGYTVGVSNLIPDASGHYYLQYQETDSDDYKYYVDLNSDAKDLTQLTNVTRLYLDKVGQMHLDETNMSEGGTVLALEKDKSYICEFYTGTYYQDFRLKANVRTFVAFERFISYDYEFLHANCIAIEFPEYFVSGYYFVNGIGLVRYIASEDEERLIDEIDFNNPMILYDEYGFVIFDPSNLESDPGLSDEEAMEGISPIAIDEEEVEELEETEEEESDEDTAD